MRCREAIDPALPIPELIKLIRHSFRQCEFDEFQNILLMREKRMKVEIENVVRDRDSLKKRVDFLENTQAYLELEKCQLKEKLGRSQRRGRELDEKIIQSKEKFEKFRREVGEKLGRSQRGQELDEKTAQSKENFEKLRSEKLDVEEKLRRSQGRVKELDEKIVQSKKKFEKMCEEMDEKVVKMGKEIEELKREKLSATKTIEELKGKEIEAGRVVQELKRKDVEAVQAIDELRRKKMKCEKANVEDRTIILSPVTPDAVVTTLAHSVTKGDDETKEFLATLMSKLRCALSRYSSGQIQGK